jgi:hypothetical protein
MDAEETRGYLWDSGASLKDLGSLIRKDAGAGRGQEANDNA